MASIFLSYARDDLAVAKRIAAALELAGHKVWWDRHIGAGSRFSREIDEALRASALVVVLWSRSSIDSIWVQDEAAFGRDQKRLLPVLIDPVEPPLGFRQFQAMNFARSARKLDPLLASVAARLGQPEATPRTNPRSSRQGWWRRGMSGLAVIAALLAIAWVVDIQSDAPSHIVAISAVEGGNQRRSQELARTIAADLGRYRAGSLGALTVLGGSEKDFASADYRVEIAVADASPGLRADISLLAAGDSRILWTASVEGAGQSLVDLRQQAAARLGDVLVCAVEAESHSRGLSREVLGLYLNGCSLMNDVYVSEPNPTTLSIFRQITEKAPDFAPGWANLALLEVQSFPGTSPSDRPALRRALTAHLARARQLDPTLPATFAADAYFHPNDGTKPAHALSVLDRGLAAHPDSAILHDMRAFFLRSVGRDNEGIAAAKRAIELNPLSPSIRDSYISALAYAGRTEAAYEQLRQAEAIWPGSTILDQVRYRLDLRYGDPNAARQQLLKRGSGDLRPVPGDTSWLDFLEARIDPRPAKVERALEGFRARYRSDNGHIVSYFQTLGTFGRAEEAYRVVWTPGSLDSLLANTEMLFRSHNRSLRADPRFIALAAKLGLVQYWEKSRVWPDFCSEPNLPYDCKAEAAKLTPEQRKIAQSFIG